MNTTELSKKTVKILAQRIMTDWIHPYKNLSTSQSVGSGFFIDNQGHILTCSHVVENSKKIFIEVPHLGDEKLEVKVVGLCPDLDIALLKTIDYKNDEFYELHDRKHIYTIKPGSDVYAIGFPLGQDNLKYTKGIISGRQKSLIQTDTPINPGNSGGPLLLDGKVIGINTSIILFTNNIGYATPISFYYLIKEQFKKQQLVRRPFLGISYQNSNQEIIDINKCKCDSGILVKDVFKGSPISKCGIKEGDIICSINGIKVDNFGLFDFQWFNEKMNLKDILRTIKNGEKMDIEYWRGKKLHKKNFKYDEYKLEIDKKYPIYDKYNLDYEVFGGMIVMEMTDNHLDYIMDNIEQDFSRSNNLSKKYKNIISYMDSENKKEKRIIITHIFPNSYLNNLKILNEFDIIKEVNGKKTLTLEDYRKNIRKFKNVKGKKYLEIKTEINNTAVLLIDELVKGEKEFSDSYKYNLSSSFNFFKTKVSKKLLNSNNNKSTKKRTETKKSIKKSIKKKRVSNKKK